MSKVRVHQLAKELGISSKEAVTKLNELGEYVKGAASSIEAPAAKKLREAVAASGGGEGAEGASAPATKKTATPARKTAASPAGKQGWSKPSIARAPFGCATQCRHDTPNAQFPHRNWAFAIYFK